MRLRKLIIATHRDVGYFFAGLTILYAVSGVAVNHIEDWNPSYRVAREHHELGPLESLENEALADSVLQRLGIMEEPNAVVRMAPTQLRIFLEQRTLFVTLPGGRVLDERIARRPVFFELNYLHLNHGKGIWTWIADLYAVALGLLASTGIFIITGKKGLGGRGLWLLIAGLAVPVIYLLIVL